jgi:outer membrane protein OmpA-like peptidoglycan-associated protein
MKNDDNSHWIPISDMMSGLMAVFLFISVAYMSKTQEKTKGYLDLKGSVLKELKKEFKSDLENWNAEIDEDSLTIRFKALDALFDTGSPNPRAEFQKIINDFFPRYAALLYSAEFRDSIEEVRIEGHTSSSGQFKEQDVSQKYFYNLELSQSRSRNVLKVALDGTPESNPELKNWLRNNLTANGLSFSKPIFVPNTKTEDLEKSKRVEFRVRLKADEVIESINRK